MENIKLMGSLAMQIKLTILALFILTSCGQESTVKSAQLEAFSNITVVDSNVVSKSGALHRGNGTTNDRILTEGSYYKISTFSSYTALEYVAAKPLNYQGPVKFQGTIQGSEIRLSILQAP